MRVGALIAGAAILALTVTRALRHMVMVPAEQPEMWFGAIAFGIVLVGLALMPRGG